MAFCRTLCREKTSPTVRVLEATFDVRQARVRRRNELQGSTFSMIVPDQVFEMASGLWQRPDELECAEFDIQFIDSSLERTDIN